MTTSLASRAARLFLISDVLRNASSSRTGATFRTTIQRWLPEALESLAKARHATTHRIAKERFERRVEATLQAWLRWSLFPPAFVHGLESAFFFDEDDDASPPSEPSSFGGKNGLLCSSHRRDWLNAA